MNKYESRSRYLVGIISDELEGNTKLPRSSWNKITKQFNSKYPGGFSVSLLRHHFDRLELHCDILRSFESHPEFNLIEEIGWVTASEEAWKKHLQLHPEAQLVRGREFPLFNTMKELNVTQPGRKAAAFNRELVKPNCDVKEALEDYTTLQSHEEMLSGVLDLDNPLVTPSIVYELIVNKFRYWY
ncbi:uncharacterized protein MELLADRAFT_70375 [Melampsora larici-populina 98AG31]|uniref:Myb/SANT-like domain-containing protein n=1 Tax=Melampsora larici-populina (strain 98AG31 / pathotype 3-4-7) TaxID=747676 RepID=F4R332_MELLP|nr:uncharacterized protein MELLADRAFT_70375 [Melampsora larici-populina 98AG31]EGG12557.1 hypothetical protein MELLADRAFT_70375 [Melampsora larici-populina 98AG31]